MTKRGALQKLWGPTPKELNVHSARWLINDVTDCCCLCCYSYNAVVSGDFRNLIRLITGSSTILAPSTYSTFLDADFERFCLLTERKLKDGFKAAYFFPFLNVLHDNCTAGSGKKGLVGSSVRLINKRWELTIIPLLVAVHNGSQSSAKADEILKKWYQHAVNWVRVASQQVPDDKLTTEAFTRLLLVRREDAVCWDLQVLGKYVDVCRWYRETGAALFPSIAAFYPRLAMKEPIERLP
ncbi:hypothetical protein Pcac1_g15730 [Phytophthora cactorum]|nr:hypothetical protein Pcac1_g15730 [Phytophthora cactorum]